MISSVPVAGSTRISLVRRGPRLLAISSRANSMAPSRRSPAMISSMKPTSFAFSAGIGLASSTISMVFWIPMMRGMRCVPPAPGMMPSVTSGSAKRAVGTATR
jgi:hypothetical protein